MKALRVFIPQIFGFVVVLCCICVMILHKEDPWTPAHYALNTVMTLLTVAFGGVSAITASTKVSRLCKYQPDSYDDILEDMYGKDVCSNCKKLETRNQKLFAEVNDLKDTLIKLKV